MSVGARAVARDLSNEARPGGGEEGKSFKALSITRPDDKQSPTLSRGGGSGESGAP